MSDARKKLIETVAATISGDLSDKLDILERDSARLQSVVSELEKHEQEARHRLERLYAEIAQAGETLKQAETEAESIKTTAHGHADSVRAEARAESLQVLAKARRDADRVLGDMKKANDAAAKEVLNKKQELKTVQSVIDAARNDLAALRQQARKFADG